jgi:hypothetical protein
MQKCKKCNKNAKNKIRNVSSQSIDLSKIDFYDGWT